MRKTKSKILDIIPNVGIIVSLVVIASLLTFNWDFYSSEFFGNQMNVSVGDTVQMKEQYSGNESSKLKFSSSDDSVASIDMETGVLQTKKGGDTVITVTAEDGSHEQYKIHVSEEKTTVSEEKGTVTDKIRFEKTSYTCIEGEVFDTLIHSSGTSKVRSFRSNNSEIASIDYGTSSGAQANCTNCMAVHVTCKKAGTTTLGATSSMGTSTTVSLKVEPRTAPVEETGWIQYEKKSYSCKAGEVIDTKITAGGVTNGAPSIRSFGSSNGNIATVESGTSTGLYTNCINCHAVHITCKRSGTVTLRATSSTGAVTTSSLTVEVEEEPVVETGWIKYDKSSYSCKAGEVIDTKITAGGVTNGFTGIRSYGSSDGSIATVEAGTSTGFYTNCINCQAVHITCKKSGTVTLNATSTTGAKATSKVTVEEPVVETGWIKYDKSSYSCKAGEVIDTKITAGGVTNGFTGIRSYGSSDGSIATVEAGTSTGLYTNCINCQAVHITCKKSGTVTLNATSTTGAKATSKVTVEEPVVETGWIKYDKSSYSCKAGEVIDTKITAGGVTNGAPSIRSYWSSDSSMATVEAGTSTGLYTKCINCQAVHITCKKSGTVTVYASSSTGAVTSSKVTISDPVVVETGWIKYDKSSYSCKAGEVIDTKITAGGVTNGFTGIRSYWSSDSSMATVEAGTSTGLYTKCINCQAVHITCKKSGTVTVYASSSTGAVTSSKVTISDPVVETGWIKYDKSSYSCKAGEVIDTKITAGGVTNGFTGIRSYWSSDSSMATVEAGTSTGLYTKCINCQAVHITCKKSGTVTLNATSSTGAKTTSTVVVDNSSKKGWIQFSKSTYTCYEGEVFDTMITTGGAPEGVFPTVKSYKVSNSNYASIDEGTSSGAYTKCINCRAVHVTCKKSGRITISATSSTGASTVSTVKIKKR